MLSAGSTPPTPNPRLVTKPTPQSALNLETATVKKEEDEGSDIADSVQSASGTDADGDHDMTISQYDPAIAARGPPIMFSDLYPAGIPPNRRQFLPFHPTSAFITREKCTQTGITNLETLLQEEEVIIRRLAAENRALEMRIPQMTKIEANMMNRLSSDGKKEKVFKICNEGREELRAEIDNSRRLLIRHEEVRENLRAQRRAAMAGYRFAQEHPRDQFVVYLRSDGEWIQRTNDPEINPFPTRIPLPTLPTPTKRPKDRKKRGNVHTNFLHQAENDNEEFKIVRIETVFEFYEQVISNHSKIIVFPEHVQSGLASKIDEYMHTFAMFYDTEYGWFVDKYGDTMLDLKKAYQLFLSELYNNKVSKKVKYFWIDTVVTHLNNVMSNKLKWYYNPKVSVKELTTLIKNCWNAMKLDKFLLQN